MMIRPGCNLKSRFLSFASLRQISTSARRHEVAATTGDTKIRSVRQSYDDNRFYDYTFEGTNGSTTMVKKRYSLSISSAKSLFQDFIGHFLPRGYPSSVVSGYDRFAAGQLISITMGTTCGVLSMQSMLFAIGAGSGALPLAATLNWIIKDGLGQFGGILFASLVNNRFDADPKRWRMIASVSMDASSLLELLTPLFPGYFLPLASIANVGKNISFLSASASRAAIHRSFCLHENLADVTVKSGSQSIAGSLVGTGLGLAMASSFGQDYNSVLAAFCVCSAVSIGATYSSLKHVTLTTVSLGRLDCLLQDFMHKYEEKGQKGGDIRQLLRPSQVRELEYLLGNPVSVLPALHVGSSLQKAVRSQSELHELNDLFASKGYLLNCYSSRESEPEKAGTSSSAHGEVHLLYKENASLHDMVCGLAHAYILRSMLYEEQGPAQTKAPKIDPLAGFRFRKPTCSFWEIDVLRRSLGKGKRDDMVNAFAAALLEGDKTAERTWVVDPLMLEPERARVSL
eukprot:GSChrysophyteH1.ASY1.ANO1.2811.1 assembled CDS